MSTLLAELAEQTAEAFLELMESFRLILLSPRSRHRNALLTSFLSAGPEVYFYTLSSEDTDLGAFLSNLVAGVQDFDPKFGKQLSQALNTKNASIEDCADALVGDIKAAKSRLRFLVLDSFDFLTPAEAVYEFFDHVVRNLPRTVQIIINSRDLAYHPWSRLIRDGLATVIGDKNTLDGGIFDPSKPDTPHLEIYGLAGGNVYVNGMPLTTWDGPLPRNLFYYFVDHPMVTRDEIFETFWPDLPTKEATNVFHVTKRKISERLGYELTAYMGGFYRPSGQMTVHYDARQFEEIVENSQLHAPNDPQVWYSAIRLYRTHYLQRIDMAWVEKRREQLRLTYAEALIGVARLYRTLREEDRAISYFLRALREVPQREDLHRDLMTIYSQLGQKDKAIAQYKHLSDILQRTLKIPPSKHTQTLYKSISEQF